MADAAPAPYSTATANLRDSAKWLATALSALGVAFAAGVNASGLSGLDNLRFGLAIIFAGGAFFFILVGVNFFVEYLLTHQTFAAEMAEGVTPRPAAADWLDLHHDDLLPAGCLTIAALQKDRVDWRNYAAQAQADWERTGADADKAELDAATTTLGAVNANMASALDAATFFKMRSDFDSLRWKVFRVTMLAFAGMLAYAADIYSKPGDPKIVAHADFTPGPQWAAFGQALAKTCGDGVFAVAKLNVEPFKGWVEVTFDGPGPCAGMKLDMPADMAITPPQAKP